MSDKIKELNSGNFTDGIASGVTLVDFWAEWCGPCKMQLPILESVAGKAEGVSIAKVNVDQAPELAAQFGIRSIPTLIIFKDGEVAQQMTGMQQEAALLKALEEAKG